MKINKLQTNIPGGWQKVKLGDIGKVSMCKRIFRHETLPSGAVPFYKISTFGKTADSFISEEIFERYKSKYPYPNKGEVLISASGTIGRTVVFDGEKSYFQDSNIVWIANPENKIINEFLKYIYLTTKWKSTDGGIISRLYNEDLKSIKFDLPSIPEQKRIVAVLETWDQAIEKLGRKIGIKKKIKKCLMQNLLTGKVRLTGFKDKWLSFEFSDCFYVQSKIRGEKKQDYLKEGLFPIIDQSQSRIAGYSNNQALVVKTNLPFIIFGDHTRILKLIDFPFILGNDGTKVFQGKNGYDTKFLFYLLSGISVPNTGYNRHFKFLKDLVLEIPKSKKEQEAIADIIAVADEEVMMIEKKLSILKDQKRYLLNNLITGQIRIQ